MAEHGTPTTAARRRRVSRGSLSVALVLALAGTLFVANARLARSSDDRHPQDLRGLASAEDQRVSALAAELDELEAEIGALSDDDRSPTTDRERAELVALAAGARPVSGPGLTVVLDDAEPTAGAIDEGRYTADDFVVHQQDLQGVINALWAGGAEAMTIQGQRVTMTTAVRCVGNVLLLQGRVHSPPYTIRAIGDPAVLRTALDDDPTVTRYRAWVAALGLGYSVSAEDEIDMDAYQGPTGLGWAVLPDGVSPFSPPTGAS